MRYSSETNASATNIIRSARRAFGPEGAGLRQSSISLLEVTFSGESGTVEIVIRPIRAGLNEVEIASQTFDVEAAEFARSLPHPSAFQSVFRLLRSKIRLRMRR